MIVAVNLAASSLADAPEDGKQREVLLDEGRPQELSQAYFVAANGKAHRFVAVEQMSEDAKSA